MDNNCSKLSLVLIVTSLVLAGCKTGDGPAPVESSAMASYSSSTNAASGQSKALSTAEHYLQLASKATPPRSYEYQLLAAEMYIQANEPAQAEQWLEVVPTESLEPRLKASKNILIAELNLSQTKPDATIDALEKLANTSTLSKAQVTRIYELRSIAYDQIGDTYNSAIAKAELDNLLINSNRRQQNREALWQAMGDISISDLETAAQRNDPFGGWAQLALILRNTKVGDLDNALDNWEQQHPRHPAADFIPKRQQSYAQTTAQFPNQIALLLPLSGTHQKAAEALRDGFLTRYYSNEFGITAKPKIKIYDTTSVENVQSVYKQAVAEGADFVVGPLMKQNVLELSKLSRINVPVLALNQNDNIEHPPRNFYQFALAPEDEAEQIAVKAASMRHKNAAIVVPNNNWGDRIIEAFAKRWQGLGGHVVSSVKVSANEDQAKAIRALLNVDNSQERSHNIKYSIREKVNYQPRRRQDVDVIIMAAPPEQARQLKPLFNFYFAEDLPVFATSSVYAGKPTPGKDQDMNDVMFCDMPWLLSKDKRSYDTRALINHHWPQAANQYARLFAMGVDAYDLSAHVRQLHAYPHTKYQGATGFLSLGPDYRVNRDLVWAKFSKGLPEPIN